VLTFPFSLSLSLSYFYTLQYKKAQASFWTAGTFQSFLLLSSFVSLFFLNIARGNFKNLPSPPSLTLSLSLSLSLSRIRQQSHRGSRFARRHEALGKAHPGREALHLARVGVLRRFGWDCLRKLGRPFHEGDPNPRGTFSSFALSLEMCASIFTNSYSPRVCHDANTTLTEIHSLHRREHSMDSKLPSRTFTLVRLCDRDHVFRSLILGGEKIFRCSSFSLSFLRLLMTSRGRKKLTRVKNFHHRIHNRNVLSPHRSIHQGSGGKDEIVQGGRYDPMRAKEGGMGLEMGA